MSTEHRICLSAPWSNSLTSCYTTHASSWTCFQQVSGLINFQSPKCQVCLADVKVKALLTPDCSPKVRAVCQIPTHTKWGLHWHRHGNQDKPVYTLTVPSTNIQPLRWPGKRNKAILLIHIAFFFSLWGFVIIPGWCCKIIVRKNSSPMTDATRIHTPFCI